MLNFTQTVIANTTEKLQLFFLQQLLLKKNYPSPIRVPFYCPPALLPRPQTHFKKHINEGYIKRLPRQTDREPGILQ